MKRLVDFDRKVLMVMGVLFTAMTVLSGCSDDEDDSNGNGNNNGNNGGSGGPGTNEVWMQGSAFTPATLTVSVGTKITWTNKDGMAHTVTSNTGVFDSGNMVNNAVYSYTFTSAGTYPYVCTLHPGMTGSIVVN